VTFAYTFSTNHGRTWAMVGIVGEDSVRSIGDNVRAKHNVETIGSGGTIELVPTDTANPYRWRFQLDR
jgi:hypothetical protein